MIDFPQYAITLAITPATTPSSLFKLAGIGTYHYSEAYNDGTNIGAIYTLGLDYSIRLTSDDSGTTYDLWVVNEGKNWKDNLALSDTPTPFSSNQFEYTAGNTVFLNGTFTNVATGKNAICNQALSFIGEPTATPFTGGTTLRDIECRAHYDSALIEVLTHHRWDFARSLVPLSLVDPQPAITPANFPKAYRLPTYPKNALLRLEDIRLENGALLPDFEIIGSYLYATSATLTGNIAYTTAHVLPGEMLPIARECIAYALAIRIGESLTGNPQKVEQMRAHLAQAYTRAITTETRQTQSAENRDPLLIARQCGAFRSRYQGYNR
jgi:hypothetical protein